MSLVPTFCPHAACPSRSGGARFACRSRGSYFRKCDQRTVQRFKCLCCPRGFSEQTFRVNYRLKRPDLLERFFLDRVSKVTHRQSARTLGCSRTTEERHFRRLSAHCKDFHEAQLDAITARGGLGTAFLLDELETYEHSRLKKPVTVPVLIERSSGFLIDTRAGALPARRKKGQPRPPEGERRKSESREVVQAAFERLRHVAPKEGTLSVLTDKKDSYARILKKLFGERCEHSRTPSSEKCDKNSPLGSLHHTLAMLRDGTSRLVRENWAASKMRRWLAGHLLIWTCYRNYVRDWKNWCPRTSPAMALGALERQWGVGELLDRRVFR